jgi:hypothetical protein
VSPVRCDDRGATRSWRGARALGNHLGALTIVLAAAAVVVALLMPPLRQDPAYHAFADRRRVLGVPYGLNVLSNVGFVLVGAWAIGQVARAQLAGWERVAGNVFGLGLVLTGLGSAWYHTAPDNATLVWDRLPLAALFPSVFAVVVGDRVSAAAGRALLAPLVLGAVASVIWWHVSDDLRPYALAQFGPLLRIPIMLALRPGRRPTAPLLEGVALYALGKAAEVGDRVIFGLGGIVSGHTVKHLLTATAAVFIVRWLAPPSAPPERSGPSAPSSRRPARS